MNFIENVQSKDAFSRFVGISLIGHIVLIAFLTLKAVVFPSEPIQIRSAIRVDMVALPDKIEAPAKPAPKPKAPEKVKVPEPAKAKPKPKPKPKPKAPPKPETKKVNLDKTKNEQQDALNRLKAMQAIEKMREQQKEKEEETPQEYKGNVLSEGNSFTGLAQIEFDRYFSDIESAIRQNWNLPKWLEDGGFRATVRVRVDERGYVVSKNIETSSGNDAFDDVVLTTVEQSSPLPPPPARLKNVLSIKGFVINFPE